MTPAKEAEIDTASAYSGFGTALFDNAFAAFPSNRLTVSDGRLGLSIRAGLHTGECEVTGGNIAGIAVHTGARVAAKAGPDEVLVSSTVRDLVAGSGIEFKERGSHELKGLPGEWRLFAVERAPG